MQSWMTPLPSQGDAAPLDLKQDVEKNAAGIEVAATFHSFCILSVRAETNTPRGGDGGHGGKTRVAFSSEGICCEWEYDEMQEKGELVAFGDCEAEVLIAAFEFAAKSLREQQEYNRKTYPVR